MITLESRPAVHAEPQRPDYSTCYECHRSFRAKSEDQDSVGLCDTCFDAVRHTQEPVISIHVKVRPHGRILL